MVDKTLIDQIQDAWDSLSPKEQARYKTLGKTIAAVGANAFFGNLATKPDTAWYRALRKPWFQPPKWVFPVAWTALYTDIAAVTGLTLADLEEQGREAEYEDLKQALLTNIILNFGWSFLFFTAKKPFLATIEAGALAYSSAGLVRRAWDVNETRGKALLPYALWTAFATALTFGLWRRNRKVKAKDFKHLDD